ncbi:hypothetical protein QNN00_17420 [Bacillus velezensis]|nr:hypothetical protein [Bacillus velezensis]
MGFIQKQGLEDKFFEHMKQVATYEEDQRYRVRQLIFEFIRIKLKQKGKDMENTYHYYKLNKELQAVKLSLDCFPKKAKLIEN